MRRFPRAAAAAILAFCLTPTIASAHSWYPHDCCNDRDCAVVVSLKELPDGVLRVETEHGFAFAPRGFEVKPSMDSKAHACLRQIGSDEEQLGWALVCLFLPGLV